MRYVSTRGGGEPLGFEDVLLQGLAPDGGLYVPDRWPGLPPGWTSMSYPELAAAVLALFVEPDPLDAELPAICREAYGSFRHPDVTPLRPLRGDSLLELFWGPTWSFKDLGLAVVGRMLASVLGRRGRRALVLGATSGDTGAAAISACAGLPGVSVVILYPAGRVTEVQRRQMTTVADENVRAVEVAGTFDDCQALVKQAFGQEGGGDHELVAVNSINWGRVAAQIVYYLWAAARTEGVPAVSVPTGNFGNAFAGWCATRMGLDLEKLIIANNRNHLVTELVGTGRLKPVPVVPTVAPAMDVGVPSNLERYLFELAGRDPQRLNSIRTSGRLTPGERGMLVGDFAAGWTDDDLALSTIRDLYEADGVLVDPHTAIAWEVGSRLRPPGSPLVVLATADVAKFGPTIGAAIGGEPPTRPEVAELLVRPERAVRIEPDPARLQTLLSSAFDGFA
jgi:threonine synthase